MKLLIINQYFYPDVAATAQLLTDLSEDLADKEMDITVLTGNSNYLGGKLDLSANGKYIKSRVIRVNSFSLGKKSTIRRLLDYLSFYILVILKSFTLPKHDIVLILTTPPLISLLGLFLKALRKSKLVCLVEDLYPDTAIALGFIKANNYFVKVINSLSKLVFQKSDLIIAISKNMKSRLINKGVDKNKIVIIDNWADKKQIYPIPMKNNWFLKKHKLEDCFVIEYSGNMGLSHDFDTILQGSKILSKYQDIKFLFIGDGGKKKEILRFKTKNNLNNTFCLPYQDRNILAHSISAGNISLVSLKSELEGCIMPCKIYGIMAAGRPIIFIGDRNSDIANIIKNANCGYQIDDGDVKGFVEKVLLLYKNQEHSETLGSNGYQYFLHHFERELASEKYYKLLTTLA